MKYIILLDGKVVGTCEHMCEEAINAVTGTVLTPDMTAHISNMGAVILSHELDAPSPDGYSNVRSPSFAMGKNPDGKGGWILPPPPPAPDATSVLNWQLSAALAAKGVSFTPTDATIAARWQFEPSFAIEGVVAKALQASLGYDASQLQALFNEAAALT